jgi:hypothetical protein
MDREPVVVQESARERETWPGEDVAERGLVYWITLVSGGLTQSDALTRGIIKTPPPRHCTNTGTGKPRSISCSKEPAWSGSTAKRGPLERGPRSSYLATPRTPSRIPVRRKCGSLTFLLRTLLQRSSTSSRIEPGLLPGRTTGEIFEKLLDS